MFYIPKIFAISIVVCFALLNPSVFASDRPPHIDAEKWQYRWPAHQNDEIQSSGEAIGRIIIEKIGVDEVVHMGVNSSIIDKGVAYWANSGKFGGLGNVVLAGHRTIKTRPFYRLAEIEVGESIVLYDIKGDMFLYKVSDTFVVEPTSGQSVVDPPKNRDVSMLTIFTCHPLYSQAKRLVVRAKLITLNYE